MSNREFGKKRLHLPHPAHTSHKEGGAQFRNPALLLEDSGSLAQGGLLSGETAQGASTCKAQVLPLSQLDLHKRTGSGKARRS